MISIPTSIENVWPSADWLPALCHLTCCIDNRAEFYFANSLAAVDQEADFCWRSSS